MAGYEPAVPSQLSKASVHSLAESIARQLDFEPGDDIYDLIDSVGGRVEVQDTLLTDPEMTGSLYVDGPEKFRIIVPAHTSPERDRFTIAHEFGHFVVHYVWNSRNNPDYPERVYALRKGSDRIEWEANWFAAAFLMPRDAFEAVYNEVGGDIWQVAERFKVSTRAAQVRAADLGLV